MFSSSGGSISLTLMPGYRATKRPITSPTPTTKEPEFPEHKQLDLTIKVLAAQSLPLPSGETKDSSFHPYVKLELHVEDDGHRLSRHLPAFAAAAAPKGSYWKSWPAASSLAKEGQYKAKTHTSKGRDPDFGAQELTFKDVAGIVDELTFARFTVRNDEIGRDELVAWACVRLDRLGEGYRFVHLLDAEGVETEGLLLIRVSKKLALNPGAKGK